MRSPVIAFSIIAAAVSPTLVSGAPASPKLDNAIAHTTDAVASHQIRDVPAGIPAAPVGASSLPLGALLSGQTPPSGQPSRNNQDDPVHRTQAMKKAKAQAQSGQQNAIPKAPAVPAVAHKAKRAGDQGTAGGNAYSGAASSSSGGDVVNEADRGTLTNADGSNAAGGAGSSFSGFAFGGTGDGHGPGGNAYTGATGASRGGNVVNVDENPTTGADDGGNADVAAIDNPAGSNAAGGGGFSESGSAEGGDAAGPPIPQDIQGFQKRAGDYGTAGGNAYSGATSDVSGGSVVNSADDRGTVTNDGNTAGGAGTTFSGDADGGNGNGLGPGGNAYTGSSGPAEGGSIYNYGGTIDNGADSNAAGGGGVSETGDATGGRA
ncbi:hypothetical protein BN946_scf184942.g65 [Trametes cinnabarina]|uniref:Uncharacterized protein n=1 Tax=Pycnoporus cinnabarinus TaxID=5643 RepID=A0A060S7D7_PYCCI|nr:hypothetical protein BN946_scf184942.g65 [Trametes cinnabarina]